MTKPESSSKSPHHRLGKARSCPNWSDWKHCYATGCFSSRSIEAATYSDVAVRYICGGDAHPDHDTICTFKNFY